MIHNNTKKGFTIVELIVVITILAILGTIGFISYVSHISNTRDSSRLSQISIIYQAIESNTKGKVPVPDNKVSVYASGVLIGYQGYAGDNVLSEIGLNEGGKDPQDGTYYTYFTDSKQKNFQLLTFLENEQEETSYNGLILQTQAADYSDKIPRPFGLKLGILVESVSNTPIQEVTLVKTNGLDIVTTTGSYTAYITGDKTITGTGKVLQKLQQTIWHKGTGFGAPRECPEGFLKVPGNPDFSQPGFCVMKYVATYEDATTPTSDIGTVDHNTIKYVSGKIPVSKPGLYPIADINQQQAIDSCKSMGEGYHLITNDEWMTIARNIEQVGNNWSGNSVGSGGLYRGITGEGNSNTSLGCATANSNGSHTRLYASSSLNSDTTKWGSSKQSDCDSKRQHQLSNGEIIWDLAGNVREHVNGANTLNSMGTDFATMQGNACGGDNRYSFAGTDGAVGGACSFVSPYTYAKFGPKITNLNANNGIGRIYSYPTGGNNRVLLRGAPATYTTHVGVFSLGLDRSAVSSNGRVGFRCAK